MIAPQVSCSGCPPRLRRISAWAQRIAPEHILLASQGGEEQNRHLAVPAHGGTDFEAIQMGHENIQQNGVIVVIPQQIQCLLAIPGQIAVQTVGGKVIPDNIPDACLILDDQNGTFHTTTSFPYRIPPFCVGVVFSFIIAPWLRAHKEGPREEICGK